MGESLRDPRTPSLGPAGGVAKERLEGSRVSEEEETGE